MTGFPTRWIDTMTAVTSLLSDTGMKQTQLAGLLGVKQATISAWARGESAPQDVDAMLERLHEIRTNPPEIEADKRSLRAVHPRRSTRPDGCRFRITAHDVETMTDDQLTSLLWDVEASRGLSTMMAQARSHGLFLVDENGIPVSVRTIRWDRANRPPRRMRWSHSTSASGSPGPSIAVADGSSTAPSSPSSERSSTLT